MTEATQSGFEFVKGDTVTVRVRENGTRGNIVAKFTAECVEIDTLPVGGKTARFDLPGMMNRVSYRPYEAEFEVKD